MLEPPLPPPPPTDCAKIPYDCAPLVLIVELAVLLFTVTLPPVPPPAPDPPIESAILDLPPFAEVLFVEPPLPPPPPTDCAKIA